MFGKKIVKRCAKGHEMDLSWRRCPRCTGRTGGALEGRDITEATVVLGPSSAPADETRIVTPSVAGRTPVAPGPPAPRPPAPNVQEPFFTAPRPSAPSATPYAPPASPPPAAQPPAPQAPTPAAAPGAMRLECTGGPLAGQSIPLEVGRVYKFGKAPQPGPDFKLVAIPTDRFMSKEHALLTVGTAQLVLNDPGSTNGSFVNGEKISRVILKDGDEIRFGESFFRLSIGR